MSSLKQLSKIDKRTRFKVYGWIREAEKELSLNYIPTMISNICILYVRDDEIFHMIGDNVKLSNNKKCLTKINANGWKNCNFGINEIPSKSDSICQWDVKVIDLHPGLGRSIFRIGVSSSTLVNKNMCHYHAKEGDYYVIYNDKYKCEESTKLFQPDRQLPEFGVNDIVSIYLHLKKEDGNLSVAVNGGDKYMVYSDIKRGENISYRLMVALNIINDSVEIVNFTRFS